MGLWAEGSTILLISDAETFTGLLGKLPLTDPKMPVSSLESAMGAGGGLDAASGSGSSRMVSCPRARARGEGCGRNKASKAWIRGSWVMWEVRWRRDGDASSEGAGRASEEPSKKGALSKAAASSCGGWEELIAAARCKGEVLLETKNS